MSSNQTPWYFVYPSCDVGTEFMQNLQAKLVEYGLVLEHSMPPNHPVEQMLHMCEGCIILAFKSGFLGSSVAMIAQLFLDHGKSVYEITYQDDGSVELLSRKTVLSDRVFTLEETLQITHILSSRSNGGR